MPKFDHFNLISPIYDMIFGRRQELEIVQLAEVNNYHNLLDVGGGTGRVTLLFKSLTDKIWVADSAMKMLRQACEKRLTSVNSESEHLPFPAKSFDRIIMVDALHHVIDQRRSLDEMWRLLSPDGKMIIEEPDINHWLVKLIALGERLMLMRSRFLKPQTVAEMCKFDPQTKVEIIRRKGIAWIIITKQS